MITAFMIQHVPLDKGSEINYCAQRFSLWMVHFPRISRLELATFVVSGRQKYRNLVLFLPASIDIHQEKDEIPAKYK